MVYCIHKPKKIKMKHLMKLAFFKYALLLFFLTVTGAIAWASDSTVTATTTTSSTSSTQQTWYTEPWVWIVGGAVLILLIVALTRGNSSSSGSTDKVTVTKTHTNDTE